MGRFDLGSEWVLCATALSGRAVKRASESAAPGHSRRDPRRPAVDVNLVKVNSGLECFRFDVSQSRLRSLFRAAIVPRDAKRLLCQKATMERGLAHDH